MFFRVLPVSGDPPSSKDQAYLIRSGWNDWFKYKTTFSLVVFDSEGARHDIGDLKIGEIGLEYVSGSDVMVSPSLPDEFDVLDERFFSLGMSENYYESLNALSTLGERVTTALKDIAADPLLLAKVKLEPSMYDSVSRSIESEKLERFCRLARGDAELTRFDFSYYFPPLPPSEPPRLDFSVQPHSSPPSNIHIIIGRNSVGKTRLLQRMTTALVVHEDESTTGSFRTPDQGRVSFANLVSVTFSAFDPFGPVGSSDKIGYSYIGLKMPSEEEAPKTASEAEQRKIVEQSKAHGPGAGEAAARHKSGVELTNDFVKSVSKCRAGARRRRWQAALQMLNSDPLFQEGNLQRLAVGDAAPWQIEELARQTFDGLSSGHKIVLLSVTRLVETVDERTLVLIDEPEAHLHPPLLSAFVRCLSALLTQRNGVAIIATHSPVVLQEVPKSCVWILRRTGIVVSVDRPGLETFGENVGVLTSEVFGLEVGDTGYHKLVAEYAKRAPTYKHVIDHFGNLGAEAKAIARALIAQRTHSNEPGEE